MHHDWMDKYNANERSYRDMREEEEEQKKTENKFSLHLSRLYLPHSITPTRKSDKDTIAHEIVHLPDSLAHRTRIILTPFLPRPRAFLALLLREFDIIKV